MHASDAATSWGMGGGGVEGGGRERGRAIAAAGA